MSILLFLKTFDRAAVWGSPLATLMMRPAEEGLVEIGAQVAGAFGELAGYPLVRAHTAAVACAPSAINRLW